MTVVGSFRPWPVSTHTMVLLEYACGFCCGGFAQPCDAGGRGRLHPDAFDLGQHLPRGQNLIVGYG